jgi:predicted enzyme related to lactoylglutathione lyase
MKQSSSEIETRRTHVHMMGKWPQGDRMPAPGGWNRIHFVVEDLATEVERLRAAGVQFRNEIISGPGGSQIVLDDPSGNPVELFQPARR